MEEKKLIDEAVNATVKSLKWLCNQIPNDLGNSNEEKMLKCIRLYCEQGIVAIQHLQSENEGQRKIIEYQDSVEDRNAELQRQVDEYRRKIEQGTLIELPCKVGDTVYKICPKCNSKHNGSCENCAWAGCAVDCDIGVYVYDSGSYNEKPLQIIKREVYAKAIVKIIDLWNIQYFASEEMAAVALKEYDIIRSIEDRHERKAAFDKWYESRKIVNPLKGVQ